MRNKIKIKKTKLGVKLFLKAVSFTLMDSKIQAFSLRDAPSLIETLWPTGKISAECYKERKAGSSQTLTSLGGYWKGRKPLFLVRACILASLLPATENPKKDLDILEKLLGIDDNSFLKRVKKQADMATINELPYIDKIERCYRIEEIPPHLSEEDWQEINTHCQTQATSLQSFIEQLGIMRFGHKVKVSDTFCGSGSIPFEAARIGCDVYASDLNPIACMLTWGSLNIVGASAEQFQKIENNLKDLSFQIQKQMMALGFEYSKHGDQGKNYLYCFETKCPETEWMVPMLPNFIISIKQKSIASLVPDHQHKKYDILILNDVSDYDLKAAKSGGTVKKGRLFHPMNSNKSGVLISSIRGDYKTSEGLHKNKLRQWQKTDFTSQENDIFLERLYCIEWIRKDSLTQAKLEKFLAAPTPHDFKNEQKVKDYVGKNIVEWQNKGFISDMPIEDGHNTTQPKRERGWTYWNHLHSPRQLVMTALLLQEIKLKPSPEPLLFFANVLNLNSKLCMWNSAANKVSPTYYNQALNTSINYGVRSCYHSMKNFVYQLKNYPLNSIFDIQNIPVDTSTTEADIYITDPPYADAVNYHEITEFFIAWLRKNPPAPFDQWTWDSRRSLAIKGDGQEFRTRKINAYKTMSDRMPDNGLQIVMFTHQSGKTWSDIVQIFWGAGLQVMADWYIATELLTGIKKGGYVQGTHIIILRKRKGEVSGYSDEIIQEIKKEVKYQIETMTGLNQALKGSGRMENLFEDSDLQMAGYAAALRVLTQYIKIDSKNMITEALRPKEKKGETLIDEMLERSVQIANEYLLPEGMDAKTWKRRKSTERFYLKMLDIESEGIYKLDNYQNFAKAFRVSHYTNLMANQNPNNACLKNAQDFNKEMMSQADGFGSSLTRSILYALWEMSKDIDDQTVLSHLRDIVTNYMENRDDLQIITHYISLKTKDTEKIPVQQHARILSNLIKNERIG